MFSLNSEQVKAIDAWIEQHECDYRYKDIGAIGGKITYLFTPTGLGNIEIVRCVCGEEINVTEFDKW